MVTPSVVLDGVLVGVKLRSREPWLEAAAPMLFLIESYRMLKVVKNGVKN